MVQPVLLKLDMAYTNQSNIEFDKFIDFLIFLI